MLRGCEEGMACVSAEVSPQGAPIAATGGSAGGRGGSRMAPEPRREGLGCGSGRRKGASRAMALPERGVWICAMQAEVG